MFVDKVKVMVQAGDGGSGVISFRQEKFVDHGGPDGGDGGKGGDVIFVASNNQNTLAAFRHQKVLKAKLGGAGSKQKKHGKNGTAWDTTVKFRGFNCKGHKYFVMMKKLIFPKKKKKKNQLI